MKCLFTMLLIAGTLPAAQNSRLVIRSEGRFESANTVLYSVYLATKNDALSEILVSSALPYASRFIENVDIPASARYEGVADNVVQWTVSSLERDTILGPFTFRVRVDPSRTDIPIAPPFSVSYQSPSSELLGDPGTAARLKPLADTGSITVDQRGTGGLVSVGETGILLHVPEGALNRSVTLSFRRLPIDDSKLPQDVSDTWWCALYEVASDSPVEFTKPIAYALPTRRPLTTGLNVRLFSSPDLKDWRENTPPDPGSKSSTRAIGFGGSQFGCVSQFGFSTCSGFGGFGGFGGFNQFNQFGGFGVSQTQRLVGSVSGSTLTQQFGQTLTASQITDGTSNTIIAILIGLRP